MMQSYKNNRRRSRSRNRRNSRSHNNPNNRPYCPPVLQNNNNNYLQYRSGKDGYSPDTSSSSDIEQRQENRSADNSIVVIPAPPRVKLQCQLAHGSPTGLVTDFHNANDLYEKIASCFEGINKDDILYCTRNTHRADMDAVFVGSLATSDFLFAHMAGQHKEVELVKINKLLGITLSDNGAGRVFIRRIDQASCLRNAKDAIQAGDHIEKINGESMIGKRHVQVAAKLREIEIGSRFTLRLVSPLQAGFSFISSRSGRKCAMNPQLTNGADGMQTIRFKSVGGAVIEEPTDSLVLNRLNEVFGEYLGIQDDELARVTLDIGINGDCSSLESFEAEIRSSSLAEFNFPQEFLFDVWGVIDDYKHRRLVSNAESSQEQSDPQEVNIS